MKFLISLSTSVLAKYNVSIDVGLGFPARKAGNRRAGGSGGYSAWGWSLMAIGRTPDLVYRWIEETTRRAQRDLQRPVFPWEVQGRLPFPRAEGSLRRDMMAMEAEGRLIRVGGAGARQGYRLPSMMERLAWHLNGGVWPHGAESLAMVAA